MPRDLSNLRVYQVLKSEDQYEAILEKRIQRLNNWKPKAKDSRLKKEFDRCISLTKDAHKTADALRAEIIRLGETFPTKEEEILDRVFVYLMNSSNSKTDQRLIELEKYSDFSSFKDRFKENFDIAKEVVRYGLTTWNTRAGKNKTLLELTEEKIKELPDLRQGEIKMQVMVGYQAYDSYMTFMKVCVNVVDLYQLWRGLFYSVVVDIQGGELDKKIINDHLKDIGGEIVGLLPGVGQAVSMVKIVKSLSDAMQEFYTIDLAPKIVEESNFLENYVRKYQLVINMWRAPAKVMVKELKGFTEMGRMYETGKIPSSRKKKSPRVS